MKKYNKISAMTLIEILISITLFSMIIISGFYAFSAISIGKIKIIWETDIEKESYFFSEKLFQEIKNGWTIDYEEYFNRKVVNEWEWELYQSWHYAKATWFGNFWHWWSIWSQNYWENFYYCRSWENQNMSSFWQWWCRWAAFLNSKWLVNNIWEDNTWLNYSWSLQRYGQYSLQFVDYNSDANSDFWDHNWDWKIIWDDDDAQLFNGPETFFPSWEVQELYLISWNKRQRTLFRWTVKTDPDAPAWNICDFSNSKSPTWSWCLWTIEFLKLEWKDWWINHSPDNLSATWVYDWIVDTWLIDQNFSWISTGGIIAWSDDTNYRVPLFSSSINVKDVKFFLYPNKDWYLASNEAQISPYLRIQYTITSSWKKRKWIRWKIPELNFSSTINLSDIFTKK